ncbi:hypothetical protein FS764_08525 [Agrobacterium vitis]|uniref:hypothetical protein n=1 Tax=Agrobacterium vitis TaxID=373 RepID=UPI0008725DDF|nr:hypothetical protein [Agrobacterium vitis]MCE6074385.1 hypothetical protein [Agrobacterium vitis]MCF1466954.1 hypothetical protein [Agrobacterium vitis]MCM2450013.1 hypothetical protein [Agrobacterium vitis]MCM2470346.1 hypothetical protein [Agrobacterium vitis]MUO70709.1 hypothetical protein [Agrobacterium vitis]
MIENFEQDKITLLSIIEEIIDIMKGEGENNWIRNFVDMAKIIKENKCESKTGWSEIKKHICLYYRQANNGMGTFSDFHIWRDDFEERKKENEYFKSILLEFEKNVNF